MPQTFFAGYPAPYLRKSPDPKGKEIQQLLWGDYVTVLEEPPGEWIKVHGRNEDGWIRRDELQENRLLEVNFVDIGQGDGTFIVTPQDERILIDAGAGDNMYRFLSWRFNLLHRPENAVVPIKIAIITHADKDHYYGFRPLIDSPQFKFGAIYHNGLVERVATKATERLGPLSPPNGQRYLTDIIDDFSTLQVRLNEPSFVGDMLYPKLLRSAATNGRVGTIEALDAEDKFLPGYENVDGLSIEVLGPVRETVNNTACLRWFGDSGKSKNGHSVILRLVYNNVKMLLGGDLNIPAENYLLSHYGETNAASADPAEEQQIIGKAGQVFGADIAKACHHGSAEFTELFLRTVNALATVVSSGDDEEYAHPRPDALGAIGKYGRGSRPLIFSTELARSTKEIITKPFETFAKIQRLNLDYQLAIPGSEEQKAIQTKILALLERSVAVYGMINVRTDGHNVLIAYKLESPAPGGREFDVYLLEPDANGVLDYKRGD